MEGHGPGLFRRTRMKSNGAVVVELLSIQWRYESEFEWVSCDSNISGCDSFLDKQSTSTCNQDTSRDLHQIWARESWWLWRYDPFTVVAIGSGRSLKCEETLATDACTITWLCGIETMNRYDVLGLHIGPCGSKTSNRTKIFIGNWVLVQIVWK